MEIGRYERPKTLDSAYDLVVREKGLALGGGVWTRHAVKKTALAVDLEDLGLDYIRESGDCIELGALATLRSVETSALLSSSFGPAFAEATKHIVGVQLRNVLSVGGTVAGRYGFSDLITLLCALGATVHLWKASAVGIEEFVEKPRSEPFLLEKISVPLGARASFQSLRITNNDFPVLNASAAYRGSDKAGAWRLAVGSRPASARLCKQAAGMLGDTPHPDEDLARRAGLAASQELRFGSDTRGSAEYRQAICPALLRRAILEASR